MAQLWPWLAIAGLGALHGLSPANGWMLAAGWGLRASDAARAWRALVPIAIGHGASIAVVACAVTQGIVLDRARVQLAAGVLLCGVALRGWLRGGASHVPLNARTGHAGIALWSFVMATAHGAGLMLVPALVPLCSADGPLREVTASGSLAVALAAVGVHTIAMLLTTGFVASVVCRGVALHPRLGNGTLGRHAWTALCAVTGAVLVVRC